jgi:hypothetical protein
MSMGWQWFGNFEIIDVALADIDGDHFLDLVCSGYAWDVQKRVVYEFANLGGYLASSPSRVRELDALSTLDYSFEIELGDIDNDGDPDLVVGGEYDVSPGRVYLNDGGALADSAVWESARLAGGAVLADIDHDGWIDLLCGTVGYGSYVTGYDKPPQHKILYRNLGGTFTTDPVWTSDDSTNTFVMAAGDIDGDGDFDVVCGNYANPNRGYPNSMYLNEGGTLSSLPVWYSADSLYTTAIALGDVDGDSDLDLACANAFYGGGFVTVYLNNGRGFSPTPDGFVPPGSTWGISIGLADMDADGDLDLAVGSLDDIRAYRNETPVLDNNPGWQSLINEFATSVATGDINNDGAPDLAFGNIGTSSTLFYNRDGTFPVTPDWRSQVASYTTDIALADVYGDGFVDVITVNSNSELRVYENQSGFVVRQPSWTAPVPVGARRIALGDVDNDGRVDLAAASEGGGAVYLNTGDGFSTDAVWTVTGSTAWRDVAFGDMDNDRDLDLVFGTDGNEIYYKNQGGTFPVLPTWQSVRSDITFAIALGDIDNDSFIDLACGNIFGNTLFRGREGGIQENVPSWASTDLHATLDIALSDMDGDGDLDLVGARGATPATMHLNHNGAFSSNPVWPSAALPPGPSFESVAVADLDVDGDMDCALAGNPRNAIYYGRAQPPFKGDPLQPTNHLSNNDAYIRRVRLTPVAGINFIPISFTAIDVESDSIMVTGEYQFEGAPDWYPMEFVSFGRRAGPFATGPEGTQVDDLAWDIATIPFSEKDAILRLRVSSPRPRVALVQRVPTFLIDAGHVAPFRPGFAGAAQADFFPSVTVGDTVSVDYRFQNVGTRRLTVDGYYVPDGFSFDPAPPYSIRPGEFIDVGCNFHPVQTDGLYDFFAVQTNDPVLQYVQFIVQLTNIFELAGSTRAVTTTPIVPLGDALSIILRPSDGVHVERCKIYFRSQGDSTFATSDMAPFFESFSGVIPSWGVTESGVEYYVEMENSGVFRTDPPGAPDSLFFQAVGTPGTIATTPIPTSESDFLEGRSISVRLNLPEGTIFESGTIYYRPTGGTDYESRVLTTDESRNIFGTIAGDAVGARGVDYWVNVNTRSRTLSDPPVQPAAQPRTIRVLVPNLEEPQTRSGERYRMVSVPLDFGSDFSGDLEALLSDQPAFGRYDPVKWRCFRWEGDYAELGDDGEEERFRVTPGKAFWLVAHIDNAIKTHPVAGTSTRADRPYDVTLEPGWNQIGNPFVFAVAWDSCRVDTLPMVAAESTVVEPAIRWQPGKGYRFDVERLQPFEGYWVRNLSATAVTLKIPPREAVAPSASEASDAVVSLKSTSANDWRLEMRAASQGAEDAFNYVGVAEGAASMWDTNDRSEPPMSPGRALSLYFPHTAWQAHAGAYRTDIRGDYERPDAESWGHTWRIDVAKNFSDERVGDEVTLTFAPISEMPSDASLILVDRRQQRVVDLRESPSYTFFLGKSLVVTDEDDARFLLLVGSTAFVASHANEIPQLPETTVLHQNHPNPFNPTTLIRYDLATPGEVDLRVYDARGALVRVLEDRHRPAGRYEVGWNGENERGEMVASGVYFYRLHTGSFTQTKKLILLK